MPDKKTLPNLLRWSCEFHSLSRSLLRGSRKTSWAAVLVGIVCLSVGSAVALDLKPWASSINPETEERYIPVELWSGAEWDGKREFKMPKVDATYRHRSAYRIKGPLEWKHPKTGGVFAVYERINPGRDGDKSQIFTINDDRSGLGRLFDGRPGRDTRTYSGGLKFPLGLWKEGETRRFVYRVWAQTETQRTETITITKVDFAFEGNSHCLEFNWAAKDVKRTYDRHTYVYCPGKSMVRQVQY